MKLTKTTYPGWNRYPVYEVYNRDDYIEIDRWMAQNECDSFLLSSGGTEHYIFQVRNNHEWFILRWSYEL